MSVTDPTPEGESSDRGPAAQDGSGKRNPWVWATVGVAVIAVALGAWGLHERSNATDAKADLQAQQASPPASTTQAQPQASAPQTSAPQTQPAETQTTEDDRRGVGVAALAAAATAFAAARNAINESADQVDELEAEVDRANADADQAQQDAEKAEEQAAGAAKSAEKQKAEDERDDAQKRELRAKADAAAACAKATVEIVGEIPAAASLDEGLKKAADEVKALVPKCKDSVAAAGS